MPRYLLHLCLKREQKMLSMLYINFSTRWCIILRTKFKLVFPPVGVGELNPPSSLVVACSMCFVVCDGMWICVWCPIVAFYFACSYGMRYIAKVLKNSLHEKFPDSSEDELMKVP